MTRLMSLDEKIVITEAFIRGGRRPIAAAKALPARTKTGVLRVLRMTGLYTPRRKNRDWNMAQIRTVAEMWKAGATGGEIADAVARTKTAVFQFVRIHGPQLGLKRRNQRPLHPGEIRAIEREAEVAITRAIAGTGRSRGSVTRILVHYLMCDGKRQKIKAGVARIVDLGGMVQVTPPGPKRKDRAAA